MTLKLMAFASRFVLACTGVPTVIRAGREISQAITDSTDRTRKRLSAITNLRRPNRESFHDAVVRLKLTKMDIATRAKEFHSRSANWFILLSISSIFLTFTPAIQRNAASHFLLSAGVMLMAGAKSLAWYFRACQVRDHELYGFGEWFKREVWLHRLFAIVVAALVLIVLLLISATAHAEGFNLNQFTPIPGDASVGFLREIFGTVIDKISSDADVKSGGSDSPLSKMMVPFNSAVLFLGMLFVGYTTLKGTVDSAHDGEVLGKKMSSIWMPLRTLGGTALLLPLGSGYSLIQIAVLWLAVQSAGIANSVLNAGIDYVSENNMVTRPNIPDSRPLAANILRNEVCRAAMNDQFAGEGSDKRIELQEVPKTIINTGEIITTNGAVDNAIPVIGIYNQAKQLLNSGYTVVNFEWNSTTGGYINKSGICGALRWQQSKESWEGNGNLKIAKGPIMAAHAQAVRQMIQDLRPFAEAIAAGQKPAPGAIEDAAAKYEDTLVAAAKNAVQETNDVGRSSFLEYVKDGGWIYLPTYYNQLIQLNDVMQSSLNTLPTSSAATIEDKESKERLQKYQDALIAAEEYIKRHDEAPLKAYQQQVDDDIAVPKSWEDAKRLLSRPAQAGINQFIQQLAGSNLSHVGQIKAVGDTIITTGELFIVSQFTLNGFANANPIKLTTDNFFNVGAALSSISSILTTTILLILFFGGWAAYYIPMIPFITAVTAIIKWFVLVFESVIAAPIFAVAHVHPDGDDAVGKAGPGYMLILGNLLRPTLTVFGFFGSIWLAQPVTGYVNYSYMTAVAGAEHNSLSGIVAFLAYISIYVMIMTGVIHSVFTLVNWMPDNVLRWIGGALDARGLGDKEVDEASHDFKGGLVNIRHGMGHNGGRGNPERPGSAESGGELRPKPSTSPTNRDLLG